MSPEFDSIRSLPQERLIEIRRKAAKERPAPYVLTSDIIIPMPTRKQIMSLEEGQSEEDQMVIVLGEKHDMVLSVFDDRPIDEWHMFQRELYEHFFGRQS